MECTRGSWSQGPQFGLSRDAKRVVGPHTLHDHPRSTRRGEPLCGTSSLQTRESLIFGLQERAKAMHMKECTYARLITLSYKLFNFQQVTKVKRRRVSIYRLPLLPELLQSVEDERKCDMRHRPLRSGSVPLRCDPTHFWRGTLIVFKKKEKLRVAMVRSLDMLLTQIIENVNSVLLLK